MGHYDRRKRDCTNKGHEHTWSELRARDYRKTVVMRGGEPYFQIRYEQYRRCETEFEYHTGGRAGSLITADGCQIEKDIEQRTHEIPLSEWEV